mgnify:CR=1 FL=1
MHTKSILIDDRLSLIGSFNWDMRSVSGYGADAAGGLPCAERRAAGADGGNDAPEPARLAGRHGNSGRGVHRAGTLAAQGRLAVRHTHPHPPVPVRAVSRRAGCGADSVPKFCLRSRIIQANRKKTCDNMKHKKRRRLLHAGFCGV